MNITGEGIQGLPADLRSARSITLSNDGVERVSNGTFTGNATGWTLASGWAYSSNTVIKNGAGTGALEQSIGAQANEIYILTGTVSNWTAGTTLTPSIGGVNGTALTGNGAFTQYIITTGTGNLKFTPTTDVRCTVDGIGAKKIDSIMFVDGAGAIQGWVRGDGTSTFTTLNVSAFPVYTGTPEVVSSAGAISVQTAITHVVTNGAGTVLTLAAGVEGQAKYIVLKTLSAGGQSDAITPDGGGNGFTTITMSAEGHAVSLLYTNAKWTIVGIYGAAVA